MSKFDVFGQVNGDKLSSIHEQEIYYPYEIEKRINHEMNWSSCDFQETGVKEHQLLRTTFLEWVWGCFLLGSLSCCNTFSCVVIHERVDSAEW